jgi:Zn-finger domain-containing protein
MFIAAMKARYDAEVEKSKQTGRFTDDCRAEIEREEAEHRERMQSMNEFVTGLEAPTPRNDNGKLLMVGF